MPAAAPTPSARGWWRARWTELTDHWPLKAVSLFFASVLWLAVSGDEPGEQAVAVRLSLRTDSSVALRGEVPVVQATVTGRRRDLIKLANGELVLRRTVAGRAPDSVRLVLRPADVELPAGLPGEVHVRDVQPRTVTVRFAPVRRVSPAAAMAPAGSAATGRRPVRALRAAAERDPRGALTLPGGEPADSAASAAVDDTLADTVWPGPGASRLRTGEPARAPRSEQAAARRAPTRSP